MGLFDFLKKKDASPRVQELIVQLGSSDWQERLAACKELSKLGGAAAPAAPKLQELIDDENGDVCLAAAQAMSELEHI